MSEVRFETPENVQVSYQAAGLGTRFLAWFIDSILLWLATIVLLIIILATGSVGDDVVRRLDGAGLKPEDPDSHEIVWISVGIFYLIFGLGSFFYFGLSELVLRGQTLGKRWLRIRVVKADGFALDPGGIFVRSIFRLVDQIPLLWIVPVVTARSQRFGDLVAGTIVISDQPATFSPLRETLSRRGYAESKFHFDGTILARARRQDVEAVEKVLERWRSLAPGDREMLLERLAAPLAARLQVDCPATADRLRFLEDFLAAEYRRQYRKLG